MGLGREASLAPPCSNLRSFRKQMYYMEKSAYDIVVTFWPPAMIRRPMNCAPLLLSLRLWCYSIKIRKFSENKQIFKSERHELLFREHAAIFEYNSLPHGSCADCQQKLLGAFPVSSCSFCVTSNPVPRVISSWTCFVLLIMKLFRHSTSYFFEVR